MIRLLKSKWTSLTTQRVFKSKSSKVTQTDKKVEIVLYILRWTHHLTLLKSVIHNLLHQSLAHFKSRRSLINQQLESLFILLTSPLWKMSNSFLNFFFFSRKLSTNPSGKQQQLFCDVSFRSLFEMMEQSTMISRWVERLPSVKPYNCYADNSIRPSIYVTVLGFF